MVVFNRYNLEGSGMVIIEVKMLTAFYPDLAGLLSQHELLKRIEFKGNRLILYFDEVRTVLKSLTVKFLFSSTVNFILT